MLASDVLLLGFVLWSTVGLAIVHGLEGAIEPSGILLIETIGAYLIGRLYVRDLNDFAFFARALLALLLVLVPFAVLESLTDQSIPLELARRFATVHGNSNMDPRMGLFRAQSVFPHSIHFGVFSAAAFVLVLAAAPKRLLGLPATLRGGIAATGVVCSASAGALVAIAAQIMLLVYDRLTRGINKRWPLLGVGVVLAYVAVDALSNRSPFEVFISYLTFNIGNSYNRVLIWIYGSQEALRNPLFGIGFNEWQRPHWMSTSMDNFWLLIAVRHGLPALAFFAGALLLLMWRIGRANGLSREAEACRTALLIAFTSLVVAGGTVHFWGQLYVFFMFLVGSGAWMLSCDWTERPSTPGPKKRYGGNPLQRPPASIRTQVAADSRSVTSGGGDSR